MFEKGTKKFAVALAAVLALGLGSCTIKYPEIQSMENKLAIESKDFIDLRPLILSTKEFDIYVDRNTDVLYFYVRGYAPIMKADGTCLTLTEWKENRKGANRDGRAD